MYNIYRKCIKAIQDERVNQQLKTAIAHWYFAKKYIFDIFAKVFP
jgi:hypothetical protein